MEKFTALLAFCAGNSRGALMFSLMCAWINRWVNNREAGDLRRHQAHYDISVMKYLDLLFILTEIYLIWSIAVLKDFCGGLSKWGPKWLH